MLPDLIVKTIWFIIIIIFVISYAKWQNNILLLHYIRLFCLEMYNYIWFLSIALFEILKQNYRDTFV